MSRIGDDDDNNGRNNENGKNNENGETDEQHRARLSNFLEDLRNDAATDTQDLVDIREKKLNDKIAELEKSTEEKLNRYNDLKHKLKNSNNNNKKY